MSEFGNEALTATMKLNEKTIDAIMKMLRFVIEKEERELNKELKKLQIDKVKSDSDVQKAEEFLARKKGVVQAKDMMATGKEIVPLSIPMSEKQFERFGQLAEEYGINTYCTSTNVIYNQMKDVKEKIAEKDKELYELKRKIKQEQKVLDSNKEWNLDSMSAEKMNEKLYFNSKLTSYVQKEVEMNHEKRILEKQLTDLSRKKDDKIAWVFAKDLERVKAITERMNMEVMIQKCDERIDELQSKDFLTEEEKKEMQDLLKEKRDILNNEFDEFNGRNNEVVLNNSKNMSFDEAIGTVTDRKYGEQPCYICNRINPDNYAEVSIKKKKNNKNPNLPPTTVTLFNVYKNGIQQECQIDNFPHNRFEHWSNSKGENSGENGKDYWKQMKEQMKEVLTNDVIIFSNEKDYLKYKKDFKKIKDEKIADSLKNDENINSSASMNKTENDAVREDKDYIGIMNQLKVELENKGIVLNEQKELCSKETGEIIKFDSQIPANKKFEYKEAVVIKEQMSVCEQLYKKQVELNTWQEQLNLNNHNLEMLDDTDEKKQLYKQMSENLYTEVYNRKQDISSLETRLTNLQGEREKILSVSVYEKIKNEKIKEKEEFNLGDETVRSENEMKYEEFEEQFDSDNKGYKVSREDWDKIVHDKTLSGDSVKDMAKEIESKLSEASLER